MMKVFISHSTADSWIARRISEDLNALGVETFLDAKDIETGASIDDSIRDHLTESDEMLMLLSPIALKSHWVLMEIGGANVLKKRLIPIMLHVPLNELPQPIVKYLARDLNDIERYYDEVKKRVPGKPKPRPAPSTEKREPVVRRRPQPPAQEFKVGDRVRLPDVAPADREEEPGFVEEMERYLNAMATVKELRAASDDMLGAFLDVDNGKFLWALRWLRPAND